MTRHTCELAGERVSHIRAHQYVLAGQRATVDKDCTPPVSRAGFESSEKYNPSVVWAADLSRAHPRKLLGLLYRWVCCPCPCCCVCAPWRAPEGSCATLIHLFDNACSLLMWEPSLNYQNSPSNPSLFAFGYYTYVKMQNSSKKVGSPKHQLLFFVPRALSHASISHCQSAVHHTLAI